MIHPGQILLMAGAAVGAATDHRRFPLLAAVLSGLAGAALRAGPTGGSLAETTSRLPSGFAAVEAALFLVAAGLAVAAAVRLARQRGRAELIAAVLLGAGGVWTAVAALRMATAARAVPLLVSLAVVGGLCAFVCVVGARFPLRLRELATVPGSRRALAGLGAGALLAAVAPRAGLAMAGAVLAAATGYLAVTVRGHRRLPVAPLLTLVLVPAWWLMAAVAGADGLRIGHLAELPWSPAAERWLGAAFLMAAWGLAGVWPFHRQEPAALTAPVAALLLVQVGLPVAPDGLVEWRPLAMPLLVVGLWHAAVTGRRAAASAALALIGLIAIEPVGRLGAALLLVGSVALEIAGHPGSLQRLDGRAPVSQAWLGGVWVLGAVGSGLGASLAVEAGLHAEVVYTVAAAAALAVAAVRPAYPRMASAPSAGLPSA